ncbi:hypothetical protein FACS1894104_0030 [Actinomycetota bacterium]|nr:hypothetical protein FACS1894104_0030 [Actinomycetota bacterium]
MPKKPQQKTWVTVARVIIIGLVVLGLIGSILLGAVGSAYGDSLPTDRIDGKPVEQYSQVTKDIPNIQAPYAGLSTKEGSLLFERDIDTSVPMASTTKIMTGIIAIETTDLETPMKVTHGAANTDGTEAGLEEGMILPLRDVLYALLLPSGNDAAVVIAENLAGMESRFVDSMNAKAAELGMTATHFADASGLSDENHYTSARDYLVLARYCMKNPQFREIVGTKDHNITVGDKVMEMHTTSELAEVLEGAEATGIKTGYTDLAGYCYVGSAVSGGIELYAIVFGAADSEQRFYDVAALLEWGFRHYRTIELINSSQQVADVALTSWLDKTVPAYAPAVTRVEIFDLNGAISQEITISDISGEATQGAICGEIIWTQGDDVLTSSPVVVDQTVYPPSFFEGIAIAWQRFWGGIFGDKPNASTTILLKSDLPIPPPVAAPTSDGKTTTPMSVTDIDSDLAKAA